MSEKVYCPVRKTLVAFLPEESVRQTLIYRMVHEFQFPLELMAVEKDLSGLPHLSGSASLPNRRADLLVFYPNSNTGASFAPLLLIECKAVKITKKTFRQVTGYNYFVQAPFIAVINQSESFLGHFNTELKEFVFRPGFCSFPDLIKTVDTKS